MNTRNYNRATKFFRDMEFADPNNKKWGKFADAMDEVISTTVQVVRCKDCKYGYHIVDTVKGDITAYHVVCRKPYERKDISHVPEWFCADGERKDNDT